METEPFLEKNIDDKQAKGIVAYAIEYCPALYRLNLSNNNIVNLDVSGLTALWYLYAKNNKLKSLDVSELTSLRILYVSNNKLESLDVFGLTSLWKLLVSNNNIINLDVSGLKNLTNLYVYSNDGKNPNKLTSINIIDTPKLEAISVTRKTEYYPIAVTDVLNTWKNETGKNHKLKDCDDDPINADLVPSN